MSTSIKSPRILLAVLFVTALWVPLLVMLAGPKQDISQSEKRRLAAVPEFSLNNIQQFAGEFEKYFNDHFGLRRTLVQAFNYLQITVLGASNTEWVLVGRDGWLYQGGQPHVREMRNAWAYAPIQLERWAEILTKKNEWLESQGIAYLFVFTPNKHLAYPEHLPRQIKRVSGVSRVDQLVQYLGDKTKVPILDLRPVLKEARGKLRTYHKTDTHWNDYGGYIGYRAIVDVLQPRFPQLRPLSLQETDFETVDAAGGDLAQMLDMREWLREPRIQPRTPIERCARNPTLGPNASDEARFETSFATYCDKAPYRVLMYRDSYSFALMPYLSETFGYIYYFKDSPVSLEIIKQHVAQHKPDIVIEQRSSRWLRMPGG